MLNLYDLLGIKQNATQARIAIALARAEKNHTISEENAKFVREFLLDAEKRVEYDAKLQAETAKNAASSEKIKPQVEISHVDINTSYGFLQRMYRGLMRRVVKTARDWGWFSVVIIVVAPFAIAWDSYYKAASIDFNYGSQQVLLNNDKDDFYVQVSIVKPRGLETHRTVYIKHDKEKLRCHCTDYICHYNVTEWKYGFQGFGFNEKYPLSKAVVSIAPGKSQNNWLQRGPRYCKIHSLKFKYRLDVLNLARRSRSGPAKGISDEEYLRELWFDKPENEGVFK